MALPPMGLHNPLYMHGAVMAQARRNVPPPLAVGVSYILWLFNLLDAFSCHEPTHEAIVECQLKLWQ